MSGLEDLAKQIAALSPGVDLAGPSTPEEEAPVPDSDAPSTPEEEAPVPDSDAPLTSDVPEPTEPVWDVETAQENLKKYADKKPTLYLYGEAREMIPPKRRWPYDGKMPPTLRHFLRGSNIDRFPANVLGQEFPTSGVFSAEECNGFSMNSPAEIAKGFQSVILHRDWPLIAIGSPTQIEDL